MDVRSTHDLKHLKATFARSRRRTVLRQYVAGARLQASVVRGCDKIAPVMTLSYDFLHEHAIGRTSSESARATMRWIVRAQYIITTQTITVSNKEAFLRLSKGL